MTKTIVASIIAFGLSFVVTARADDNYGRCEDRAVKFCNAFEGGQGTENTRNGAGEVSQTGGKPEKDARK